MHQWARERRAFGFEGKERKERKKKKKKKRKKGKVAVRFSLTGFRSLTSEKVYPGVLRYKFFWFLRFVTRQIWGKGEREGKSATTAAAAAPLQKQKGDESERTQRLL
jgi:hypothetical protein